MTEMEASSMIRLRCEKCGLPDVAGHACLAAETDPARKKRGKAPTGFDEKAYRRAYMKAYMRKVRLRKKREAANGQVKPD
jgi:hypothetical protein